MKTVSISVWTVAHDEEEAANRSMIDDPCNFGTQQAATDFLSRTGGNRRVYPVKLTIDVGEPVGDGGAK